MYFHKHGLAFFIGELDRLEKNLADFDGAQDFNKFQNKIIPLLNKILEHANDIQNHQKDDALTNLFKQFKEIYFIPKRSGDELPSQFVYDQERGITNGIKSLKKLHTELIEKIKEFFKFLGNGEWMNNTDKINQIHSILKGFKRLLQDIHTVSFDLTKIIKQVLRSLDANHALRKKHLQEDGANLNDFENNINSWIHEVVE